jgi:predicted Zn finger-like uncharacterized protein
MKITCQSCQAKYTIADEKVAGKTVKIKCKKCGATIVVHGNEGAGAPLPAAAPDPSVGAGAAPGGGEEEDEGDGATRVFGNEGGPGQVEEWTVNVTDDDQRTLTPPQLVMEFQRGVITTESYVWKDGMPDWLPLSAVPELVKLVGARPAPAAGRAAPAAAPAPAPAPAPVNDDMGLGSTVMMPEAAPRAAAAPVAAAPAPAAAAAPAARRASARSGAVDLFATSEASPRVDPHAAAQAPAASPAGSATTSADRLVGERNENSVLFSLSALTATENIARAKKELSDDAMIDLGPSPGASKNNGGRGGMDDIMNLGGGGISAGPMLAPPPLLAPVVEAPVVAPAIAPVMGMNQGPLMMPNAAPPKKGSLGLILGIVGGLVVVGGVAAALALRSAPVTPPPVTNDRGVTTAEVPSAAPSAVAVDTGAVANPTPVDPAQPPTTPATPSGAATVPSAKPNATGVPSGKPNDKPPPDKTAPDKTTAPTATQAPTAAPDPGGGGKEFDRAAAMSALSKAAGAAKSCKKDDGPTGGGKVKVTFAPSGNVTSATVEGPPFAGTAVGGCIASAFRSAHVPPFDGAPISVSKSFTIN